MNWVTFMDSDYGSRYLLMNPKIRALQYYRSHDRFDSMTHVVPIQSDIILSQLGNPQDQDHTSRVLYFRVRYCRTSPLSLALSWPTSLNCQSLNPTLRSRSTQACSSITSLCHQSETLIESSMHYVLITPKSNSLAT